MDDNIYMFVFKKRKNSSPYSLMAQDEKELYEKILKRYSVNGTEVQITKVIKSDEQH